MSGVDGIRAVAPGVSPATADAPADSARAREIREAAEGFEGLFLSILTEEMLSGTGVAEANPLYAGLMTEKFGDALARSGGFGLADLLVDQLGGEA